MNSNSVLKLTGLMALAFTLASAPVQAQTAGAGAISGAASSSQSGAQAGSQSAVILNQNYAAAPRKTEADINSVPSVFAPSITNSHPCLSGGSAGLSLMGGGITGGLSVLEASCMLSFLGQPEAAIRALAANSPDACRALGNVGYYVVPAAGGRQKVVPFQCGSDVKKGGAYSGNVGGPNVSAATISTNSGAASIAYAKCDYDKASNKLTFKKKANFSSATAKAQCLASLGF